MVCFTELTYFSLFLFMCILDYQNNFFYSHRQVFLRLATKKQTMKKKHLNQTFPGDTQPLTQVKNHQSGRNQKERQAKIYQVSTWKEENSQPVQDVKKKKKMDGPRYLLSLFHFRNFFTTFSRCFLRFTCQSYRMHKEWQRWIEFISTIPLLWVRKAECLACISW